MSGAKVAVHGTVLDAVARDANADADAQTGQDVRGCADLLQMIWSNELEGVLLLRQVCIRARANFKRTWEPMKKDGEFGEQHQGTSAFSMKFRVQLMEIRRPTSTWTNLE